MVRHLDSLPSLRILYDTLGSLFLPQLPGITTDDHTAPDFEKPEQHEQANHNDLGDGICVCAHFGRIGATVFGDTALNKSRCIVEDLEHSKDTDGEADNKVDKEHCEVEFDEP